MKVKQLGVGLVGWGIAMIGLAACASTPPPNERQASSQAAIRAAKEMDAEQVPQAALYLKMAQEEYDKGKVLMNDGDNRRATYMLMRSKADAELAVALARENKTRTEAQFLLDKLRAVRTVAPTSALDLGK
jgi:ABC-type uncharacterized transport system involved in gliding motility auxiliary subunit